MHIKLTKDRYSYAGTYKEKKIYVCKTKLFKYFDMSDDPETITVRITHKEVLNSYLLTWRGLGWDILLSDGSTAHIYFTVANDDVLLAFGDPIYVSII